MTVRPNIELHADFPDDQIEDDHDIVQFPGRNIADAIAMGFLKLGYRVSEPAHRYEHGWDLDVFPTQKRKRFWMQITRIDEECIIHTENMTFWLWSDVDTYRIFLLDLQRIIEADPRFSRVGWLPSGWLQKDAPPAAGPFED